MDLARLLERLLTGAANRLLRRGIDAGIDRLAGPAPKRRGMAATEQERTARKALRKARQAARLGRKLGR